MPPKKSSNSVQVLLLTQKAEVKEVSLNTAPNGSITLAMLQALLKKKEAPELIGSYKNRAQTLFLFGYTTGKAGSENKHELPPPHDTVLCFGDTILLASKEPKSWLNPVPLKAEEYETFYTRAFGGFEDLDSEDEEEEEIQEIQEEEEEEEDEEEEEEEEVEADVEAEAEIEESEIILPIKANKKKSRKVVVSTTTGAAQIYSTYLHVPHSDELVSESMTSEYDLEHISPTRRKIHAAITQLFRDHLNQQECNEFERCIYNGTIRIAGQRHVGKSWSHPPFVEVYTQYAKHLSSNFYPNSYVSNTELYDRYRAGEITFNDISEMDTYQLFESRWAHSFQQQQIREKRQLEGNKSMATDQFLCTRCFKRECTYYEMQTRSADEPMTIFITCLNCGKHWRQ